MISVIIPVKGHRIVERLLSKIGEVDFPQEYEIIVVDADPSALNDLRATFKNVRWLDFSSQSAQSIPEQRNFGIHNAKGEIIVFIDADCIPTKDWIRNLTEPLISENEYVTCGLVKSVQKYPIKWVVDHDFKSKYVSFCPTMNSAFHKSVFKNVGLYDLQFKYGAEDVDYCWRILKHGYSIRHCEKAIVFHDWGDIKRNIQRMYGYGKANFLFFQKHTQDIIKKPSLVYGILAYPLFLLSLPLIIIFPFFPLLLIIPFTKTLFEKKSLRYSLENVYFNILYGLGFLVGCLSYFKNKKAI